MKKIWLPAFFAVAALNVLAEATGNKTLIFTTKPLLMPLLAVWLAVETRGHTASFLKRMVLAGLISATVGDVLMMFGGQEFFFLLGLVAFLFTHLFYIGGFGSVADWKKGHLRSNVTWILAFFAFSIAITGGLWASIPPGMKLPVGIYSAVITVMALAALNLRGRVRPTVFWLLFGGALLFMLSDTLLALNKFKQAREWAQPVIMATYIFGQFLITKGTRDFLTRQE